MKKTLSGKIATVIGATGFLGRHVVRVLAENGWRIRVVSRRPYLATYLQIMGAPGQIVPIQANLRAAESVVTAVSGADLVINLVGILFEKGQQNFQKIHVEGAEIIAQAAAEAGVPRLVHISTLAGDNPSKYARTKAQGEARVINAFSNAVILRPSVIFAAEDDFFNRFARMAMLSPVLPLIGGGETLFQPVFAGDVAQAVINAIERPQGAIYELGGREVLSFKQLMEILLEQIGRKRLLLSIPIPVAKLLGRVLEFLPKPTLTVDQVITLQSDSIVSNQAIKQGLTLEGLGITPQLLASVLPSYLGMYRKGRAVNPADLG